MAAKLLYIASNETHVRHFHLPYIRALAQAGIRVDVACRDVPPQIPGAVQTLDISFEKRMLSLSNLKAAAMLHRRIRKENYALVYCHTSLAAFFTRLALLGMRDRPAVVNMVHGYLFDEHTPLVRRLLMECAEKLTAPVTDLIITMNHWDEAYAKRHQLARKVIRLPGIGLAAQTLPEKTAQARGALREKLGLEEGDFLLLYAAEFSARKSQQVLIEAMAKLPGRVFLALPGEGSFRGECMALAKKMRLDGRIFFPGYVAQMPPWYMAADAAVSASRMEGLPFNIMEAMHYALPVVASDVKGNRDLILNGETGLLYPYGEGEAFAGQIMRLLNENGLAETLGKRAQSQVKKYEIDRVLPEIMDVLMSFS